MAAKKRGNGKNGKKTQPAEAAEAQDQAGDEAHGASGEGEEASSDRDPADNPRDAGAGGAESQTNGGVSGADGQSAGAAPATPGEPTGSDKAQPDLNSNEDSDPPAPAPAEIVRKPPSKIPPSAEQLAKIKHEETLANLDKDLVKECTLAALTGLVSRTGIYSLDAPETKALAMGKNLALALTEYKNS